MRPIDFVVHDGEYSPSAPVADLAEALMEPIEINGSEGEYEILSYYMARGKMILDIQRKND